MTTRKTCTGEHWYMWAGKMKKLKKLPTHSWWCNWESPTSINHQGNRYLLVEQNQWRLLQLQTFHKATFSGSAHKSQITTLFICHQNCSQTGFQCGNFKSWSQADSVAKNTPKLSLLNSATWKLITSRLCWQTLTPFSELYCHSHPAHLH